MHLAQRLHTLNTMRTHCKTLNATRDTSLRHSTITARLGSGLIAATLLIAGTVSQASVTHCTAQYSDELENTSPTGAIFIAVSPFKLNCRGGISGSLDVTTGGIAHTHLQLEKEHNGTWQRVERGNHLFHQAEPGTYRLTVEQTGKRGGFTSWQLRYSKPLP